MTDSKLEVPLRFSDGQSITVTDKETVRRSGTLRNAVASENANWEAESTVISAPLEVPFPSAAGRFLIDNIGKYTPVNQLRRPARLEDYPEANQCELDQLRDVIELANFLECLGFVSCIGFVIARKLAVLSVDQIAEYMGVPVDTPEQLTDEGMGWREDPMDLDELRRIRNEQNQRRQ